MSWIDDIGQEGFFKGMAAAMKGDTTAPAPGGLTSKDAKTAEKSFKNLVDTIKETASGTKLWKESLNGNIQPLLDVTEQLKELDEAITKAATVGEIRNLEEKKANIVRAQSTANMRITAANLATGFVKVTGTLLRGSLDYAKNLLSGMDGILAAGELAANRAKAVGEGMSTLGQMLSGAAGLASLLPPVRLLRFAFIGITTILGPLLEKFGEKAGELANEGMKVLTEQLVNTRNSFQKITSTGVLFANGMGEMRAQAGRAGLGLKEFEEAIGSSTESLASMGMGLSQATKRIGGISGELRKSNLGKELYNLGYGFKEQAELAAQTAARLNSSGRLRSMSDAEVAKVTAQYGRDLKILQGITGEDAKKKMEEARLKSLETDLLAQAYAKGGPKAVEKLQAQLASLPEVAKIGYMEFVSTGGTAIAHAATNVYASQNPLLLQQYKKMHNTLGEQEKDASAAQKETLLLTAETAKYAKDNMNKFQAIGVNARLTGDTLSQGSTDIQNGFILAEQTFTKAAVQASEDVANKLGKTGDPLTANIHALDKATMEQKVQIEALVTNYLPAFATHLKNTLTPISKFIEMLNAAVKDTTNKANASVDEKNREHMFFGEKTRSYSREMLASVVGLFSEKTAANMEKNRRAGESAKTQRREGSVKQEKVNREQMTFGEKTASDLRFVIEDLIAFVGATGTAEKMYKDRIAAETKNIETSSKSERGFWKNLTGFSKGGIANKPSIFGEKGPEAAVPLPDGRTIPVKLSGIDKFMQKVMQVMDTTGIAGKAIKLPSSLKDQYTSMFASLTPAVDQSKTSIAMASRLTGDTVMSAAAKVDVEENKTHRNDIKYLLEAQIDKQDLMIRYLRDAVDINNRILTAAL